MSPECLVQNCSNQGFCPDNRNHVFSLEATLEAYSP